MHTHEIADNVVRDLPMNDDDNDDVVVVDESSGDESTQRTPSFFSVEADSLRYGDTRFTWQNLGFSNFKFNFCKESYIISVLSIGF